MIQTVNFYEFHQAFKDYNRENNFSREGLQSLFDYLEEFEESTGQQLELDVIALCCEYTEYEDFKELQANYTDITSMEDLENNTTVILIPDTTRFIIQDF